jgi:hypothetical protein
VSRIAIELIRQSLRGGRLRTIRLLARDML